MLRYRADAAADWAVNRPSGVSHKTVHTYYTTCVWSPDVDFPVFPVLKTHLPIHRTLNPSVPSFLRHDCKNHHPGWSATRVLRCKAVKLAANIAVASMAPTKLAPRRGRHRLQPPLGGRRWSRRLASGATRPEYIWVLCYTVGHSGSLPNSRPLEGQSRQSCQKFLNRSGLSSVYLTVWVMLRCPM